MHFTIIIPTYNRMELLDLTLKSIGQQISQYTFEVIVIDDGSIDDTSKIVKKNKKNIKNLKYYFMDNKSLGVSKVRNKGIEMARGRIICFIDCGMILKSDFIEQHCISHFRDKMNVVIGNVLAFNVLQNDKEFETRFDKNNLQKSIENIEQEEKYSDLRIKSYINYKCCITNVPAPWHYFWSCNVSVDYNCIRDNLKFDENFTGWGLEDIDFGYQLHKKKYIFTVNLSAIAIHYPHDIEQIQKTKKNEEKNNFDLFFQKHNDLIIEMYYFGRDFYFNELITEFSMCDKKRLKENQYPIQLNDIFDVNERRIFMGGGNCVHLLRTNDLIVEYNKRLVNCKSMSNNIQIINGLGCYTNLEDKSYDTIVLLDYWTFVSKKLLISIVEEFIRIGKVGYILLSITFKDKLLFHAKDKEIFNVKSILSLLKKEVTSICYTIDEYDFEFFKVFL